MFITRIIGAKNPLIFLCRTIGAQLPGSEYLYLRILYYKKKKSRFETSINIDHDRKFIFIHNPKAAGTSIKRALGLTESGADHRTPTYLVHPKTWESYLSFVVIRNPFDRLVSSYKYHTSPEYTGIYYTKYPYLHDLSFQQYFDLMISEPWVIRPQVDYVEHKLSKKKADFVCHFENIAQEIKPVFNNLGIKTQLEHVKRSQHDNYRTYYNDKIFRVKVQDFYQVDLDRFCYLF